MRYLGLGLQCINLGGGVGRHTSVHNTTLESTEGSWVGHHSDFCIPDPCNYKRINLCCLSHQVCDNIANEEINTSHLNLTIGDWLTKLWNIY